MNMINDVVNIVEPMQAVLPTWLLASIIINGGKLISEVFSDDVDDEDSKSQGDDISYKGCFSSYLSDQSWPKQCQEINNLYKATPSAYSEDINFNHITSLWGRYAGTSSCVAYPKIPQDFRVDIMRNFKISESEEVIFIYDLSWGKRQKGICLTNNSIYIVTNYDDPNQRVVIDWASLSQVCYDEGNFYFIGYNENYVAIPNNFFNATFVDCQQIADFFSKIASSTLKCPQKVGRIK